MESHRSVNIVISHWGLFLFCKQWPAGGSAVCRNAVLSIDCKQTFYAICLKANCSPCSREVSEVQSIAL